MRQKVKAHGILIADTLLHYFRDMASNSASQIAVDVVNAHDLLLKAGVTTGSIVADCGCGSEAPFAIAAAGIVGPQSVVYALDVVKNAIARASENARRQGADNVETVWTDLEIYGAAKAVRTGSVDVAVLANTLFQSQDHAGMFTEIGRMLKQGGRLLVIDWNDEALEGIAPIKAQRVTLAQVQQYASVAGFTFTEEFAAGDYHWGAIFTK